MPRSPETRENPTKGHSPRQEWSDDGRAKPILTTGGKAVLPVPRDFWGKAVPFGASSRWNEDFHTNPAQAGATFPRGWITNPLTLKGFGTEEAHLSTFSDNIISAFPIAGGEDRLG